ncbi:A/G-specific adenine glycosylase [bacterium]|nr:A/G-specific adenine glycosylase [bacterium]
MDLNPLDFITFKKLIFSHHSRYRRVLPWRGDRTPYEIVISEIMLQQTQVERVLLKYGSFIEQFPDFPTLAGADLPSILTLWMGLGYNRRAIALKTMAQKVIDEHAGVLPDTIEELILLPGIGRATAGAILAFAYNKPATFIETNIRRVFIHFFFKGREKVRDSEILPLIKQTLDSDNPREWYYALMDYGSILKTTVVNPNRKSAHYLRQSRFEGSDRQIRGKILKLLLSAGTMQIMTLVREIGEEHERTEKILNDLIRESFIWQRGNRISLA